MKLREYWVIVRDACRLDLYDLNYVFSSTEINLLNYSPKAHSTVSGVAGRFLVFVLHLLKNLLVYRYLTFDINRQSVAFCFGTSNQRESLKPIAEHLEEATLVGMDVLAKGCIAQSVHPFPVAWSYIYSLMFFPLVLYRFLTSTGYRRLSYDVAFDHYWLTYGHYITCRKWLKKNRPKMVIVANDHMGYTRTLVKAAHVEGIPTCYIQHASVTQHFPPLSFDYALLEGRDALQKYDRGSSHATVFLVGMAKADRYKVYVNERPAVRSVGICTNALDRTSAVVELLEQITSRCPEIDVILRPHPGDIDREGGVWYKLARQHGVSFSNSQQEFIFDFLRSTDAIIAGDSSVLLEAALLNVVPLYYNFSDRGNLDYYGYVRHELAKGFDNVEALCTYLQEVMNEKPDVRLKSGCYCATVGTEYDGRSSYLASEIIKRMTAHAEVDEMKWQEVSSATLKAYELRD